MEIPQEQQLLGRQFQHSSLRVLEVCQSLYFKDVLHGKVLMVLGEHF
jgi:hypothetical protein